MGYWIVDGKQMTNEEYEEHKRQEEQAKERVRREAASLMNRLGQTYEALTSLLEQNSEVGLQVTDRTEADEEIYRKLRQNLTRADEAPRCRWVKQDGTTCGSPQIRRHIYCYAHKQMMEARALALRLPALEDANAIQIALMRVQKALIDDTITAKKAGLLLYSLQLAVTNIGATTFGEADERELVREVVDEQEAISYQLSAISQTLPLMNTDDTDRRGGLEFRADQDRVRGELPDAVMSATAAPGSFDAPSSRLAGMRACSG
ncbi:MAG TPA: hypothetical protein VIB39_06270 [Candidatus Angelobacter sp.]|jgi:hypothetical protein